MTQLTTVVDGYIAMWNETDPERRRAIIEQTWTEDGSYVDPNAEVSGALRRRLSRSAGHAVAVGPESVQSVCREGRDG